MEKYNDCILILDSGSGGIEIGKNLYNQTKNEKIVCLSDNLHLPYGLKSRQEIVKYINKIIKYIKLMQPKLLIIGCNTIDAIAGDIIASSLPQIPLLRIIKDTAKKASEVTINKNIAVFATPRTIEEQTYMHYLINYQHDLNVYGICCDELATLIEKRAFNNKTMDEEIKMAQDFDCDTIVLGCTHYSLVTNKFKKFYPHSEIVDSSNVIVKQAIKKLALLNLDQKNTYNASFDVILTDNNQEDINNIAILLNDIAYEIEVNHEIFNN